MTRTPRSARRRRPLVAGASAATLALILAACSGNGDDGASPTPTGGGAAAGSIDCSVYDQFGDISGKTVHVYTSIVDPEGQTQIDSYKPFTDCTGVEINYEASREFEAQLPVRIQAGSPPDIAFVNQPGALRTLVNRFDAVVPVPDVVKTEAQDNFAQSWIDYGTVNGTLYAAPLDANVKSFVWYSPKAFSDAGYDIPKTWDDLLALTDKIADDTGLPPWCAGVESGDATGWPGTDFIEDMVLRTAGLDVYNQWVTHDIPFNDPQIVAAWDEAGKILKNDKYVNAGLGDVRSIATTAWSTAGLGILDGTCWMHRAANFYAAQWPEGTNVAEDGDVWAFYLPAKTEDERPTLVGGPFVAAFNDKPEVQAFQTYLSSTDWSNEKAKVSLPGWVSANKHMDPSLLNNDFDRYVYGVLTDPATVAGYDASDQMPSEVGSGSFWTGIVNWLTGQSTQQVVDQIESTWPSD
ncbi:ABC transporter substrate-binding protein [Xylanimonas protaetiae]|uniref:Carbohydrate ABC transporter substrate-binding protein n=1 Tax=Xylanimonas protaetiae TaxID=2509457 RepID=A0A4P6F1M1_9MICO|nr:ABC transporter substrate-binding protein [Xylanimonas protaetiae]QAY69392.1 carbohydrate ABC transporter substrate-binding protein [Xylanimonas protaetiae]